MQTFTEFYLPSSAAHLRSKVYSLLINYQTPSKYYIWTRPLKKRKVIPRLVALDDAIDESLVVVLDEQEVAKEVEDVED